MDTRVLGLALALVAGLADVLGGLLIAGRTRLSGRTLTYLLGLGGGFMLAAAILGRLPEAMPPPAAPVLVVVATCSSSCARTSSPPTPTAMSPSTFTSTAARNSIGLAPAPRATVPPASILTPWWAAT